MCKHYFLRALNISGFGTRGSWKEAPVDSEGPCSRLKRLTFGSEFTLISLVLESCQALDDLTGVGWEGGGMSYQFLLVY